MAIDPISALGAGIGLFDSKSRQRAADSAMAQQVQLNDRIFDLLDTVKQVSGDILQGVIDADKEGVFDPERQIELMEQDDLEVQKLRTNNYMGSARTAGYKPGDSEPLRQMGAIDKKHKEFRDEKALELRTNAPIAKAQAYSGALSPLMGALSATMGGVGQAQQSLMNKAAYNQGMVSDPSVFLQAILPTLIGNNNAPGVSSQNANIAGNGVLDGLQTMGMGSNFGIGNFNQGGNNIQSPFSDPSKYKL